MAKKVTVLGAGLVGGPMARDLAADFDVTVVDRDADALARVARGANGAGGPKGATRVETEVRDLADEGAVAAAVAGADLVLSAVPGFLGYRTLEAVLRARKPVVDIAFFPEDALALDALAKELGVPALVDIGVAPGMSNVLSMHGTTLLDETASLVTYVGGLPLVRKWPYEYRAVFSPADVIEEYVRPARYVEHGVLVTRPALSDPELLEFPGVGTLEAFNTDGLRSMATTMRVPNMKEKTLRYPGHIDKMAVLRATGFFGTEPVDVGGAKVRPLDLTAKLLFPMWKLEPGEVDVTVMRVIVAGTKDGRPRTLTWDLFDRADPETGVHSMARTTGYTATAALRLLASGRFATPGVTPPELLGRDPAIVAFLLGELEARGVRYVPTVA